MSMLDYTELIKKNLIVKFDNIDQIRDDKWLFERVADRQEKALGKFQGSVLVSINQMISEIQNKYQMGDELWSWGSNLDIPFSAEYGYALIRDDKVIWYRVILRS